MSKITETKRRIAEMQAKITEARQLKLSYLIESELEKAEVLLVAKSVVDKLQKMAEDIAKIEGNDIIPAMEALKAAYGPNLADSFQSVASEKLRATVEAITAAKDGVSAEVAKFEGVLNGEQPGNDMAGFETEVPAEEPEADAMGAGLGGEAGTLDAAPEGGVDGDDFVDVDGSKDEVAPGEDMFGDMDTSSAAGRAKKESVALKGKMVAEAEAGTLRAYGDWKTLAKEAQAEGIKDIAQYICDNTDDPRSSEGKSFTKGYCAAVKAWVAKNVKQSVSEAKKSGDTFDKHQTKIAKDTLKMSDVGADTMGGMTKAKARAHLKKMGWSAEKIAKLEESVASDANVLNAFRRALKEGSAPVKAAQKVAEAFAIDLSDVVEIVKESRLGK